MTTPERGRIRPTLWIAAMVFFLGAGFVVHQASQHDAVASSRAAAAARGPRAHSDLRSDLHGGGRASRARRAHLDRGSSVASGGGGYTHHDWHGTESEVSRRMALGLPQDGFWRQPPMEDLERDPQLAAMWRSFHHRRDAESEAPPLPFEPLAHRAELVDAEGDVSASPQSCDVRVLPVSSGRFNCVVRVTCDGAVLYPNPSQNAGYVPCDIENGRPVRAVDDGRTDADGDPLVDLDLEGGTITVEDYGADGQRRYRATLRINS
jgi:hypothetical protein